MRAAARVPAVGVLAASVILSAANGSSARPQRPYNVILIVAECLRADRMGVYGNPGGTTVNLDSLAKRAIVFDRAVSQGTWTLPSLASLMTGKLPSENHVLNRGDSLAPEAATFAQAFGDRGYETAAFVGGYYADPMFGVGRGFGVYDASGKRMFAEVGALALEWLELRRTRPFLLLIHGNDPHPPLDLHGRRDLAFEEGRSPVYSGPLHSMVLDDYFFKTFNRLPDSVYWEPLPDAGYRGLVDKVRGDPDEIRHIGLHYDVKVRRADRYIGSVLWARFKKTGLLKNSVIVFVSDHGLELGERGMLSHGFHPAVWQANVHVPLILWHPDLPPRRVAGAMPLSALGSLLLEVSGAGLPPGWPSSGADLTAAGREIPLDRAVFSESTTVQRRSGVALHAVQDARWKMIVGGLGGETVAGRLYDLAADPDETRDVAERFPQELRRLRRILDERLRRGL